MEKPMTRNVQKTLGIRVALAAAVAFPLIIAMSARAQEPAPPPPTGTNVAPAAGAPAATEATAERVIVTGSNIPTAEEVGPNPVDTYRRDDITRLGVRDRKSTRLNSSHRTISYAVFCLKKKNTI